jgi:hypothetical protein
MYMRLVCKKNPHPCSSDAEWNSAFSEVPDFVGDDGEALGEERQRSKLADERKICARPLLG